MSTEAQSGKSSASGKGARKAPKAAKRAAADRLLDAALDLIAAEGWRDLSMGAVARAAGVKLAELYENVPSRAALLTAFARRIDKAVLAEADAVDVEGSARDRLFDVLMLRFEAMEPWRGAVRVLRRELPRDPLTLLALRSAAVRSFNWSLEAAGFSASGFDGAARSRLIGYVFLRTLDVWLDDDPRDLARTMASLDRRLRRVERYLPGGRKDRRSGDGSSAD